MLREEFHSYSAMRMHAPRFSTRAHALKELQQRCNRFKSLLSSEDKLRAFIAERMLDRDAVGSPSLVSNDGTPLNWKYLLTELHAAGIIQEPSFATRLRHNDRPLVYNFELVPVQSAETSDGREVQYGGFGGSLDMEDAMSKSVGELLERYFLSTYKHSSLTNTSYAELTRHGHRALDPRGANYFLDWQKKRFPQFVHDADTYFHWVEGSEYTSGAPTYLPAQMVFWNYQPGDHGKISEEKSIIIQTTSGSAGHFTKDEAVLGALLEAIERDAFVIYWLNSLTPKIIDTTTIQNEKIQRLLAYLKRYRLEVTFVNTTSDFGVPTATCIVVDHYAKDAPVLSIGSAAGFDLESTIIPSAIEAMIINNFAGSNETFVLPDDYQPFTNTQIRRHERLLSAKGKKSMERFKFLLSGPLQSAEEFIGSAATIDTKAKRLTYMLDELEKRGTGYELYTYDAQHPILDKLGYHVVRAIVPELIPLYLVEFAAPLNMRRIREVPAKIGREAAKEFNPWPHPFP